MKRKLLLCMGAMLLAGTLAAQVPVPEWETGVEQIKSLIKTDPGQASATAGELLKGKNKKNVSLIISIARAYLNVGKLPEAESYLKMAQKVDKKDAGVSVLEGDIALAQKDVGRACQLYEQAIYFNPDCKEAYLKYARAYRSASPSQAIDKLQQLKALAPDFLEADKELAANLDPRWGVDIIIGGHSHTMLSEPAVVAGIPIVQAANGTSQIGRFDIMVDTDDNCIDSYTWQLVPINEDNCERDLQLERVIEKYKNQTDVKYSRVVTRFKEEYFHRKRNEETQIGRIFSDIFKDALGLDIMLLGSGSIRYEQLGPIVQLQDLAEIFPYKNEIERIYLTGEQLRSVLMYILRDEALDGKTEFYQLSHGLRVVYSRSEKRLLNVELNGKEIEPEQLVSVGLQEYDMMNMDKFFGITRAEAEKNGKIKTVATSCFDVLEENLSDMELVSDPSDRRFFVVR